MAMGRVDSKPLAHGVGVNDLEQGREMISVRGVEILQLLNVGELVVPGTGDNKSAQGLEASRDGSVGLT